MDKNKKIAAVIVVLIIAVAAIGVAVYANNNSNNDKVYKIAVVKHNFEPLYIADEKGYFSDAGVKVELVSVSSGNDSATALATGKVDLAGFGSDPFLKLIDEYGDKYNYVGRWILDDGLKGAAASDTTYAFDGTSLIGAKIGVNTVVSYYSLLLKYLAQTGQEYVLQTSIGSYDINKVNVYNYSSGARMADALRTGIVDIIIAGSSNIDVVETDNKKYGYVEATETYRSLMSVGLFSSTSTVDAHSSDIAKILSAIDKACKYMENSETKDDAVTICMNKLGIENRDVMTKYINLAQWEVGLTNDDSDSIESSFEYIVKANPGKYTGTLKGLTTVDITDYFDYRCLPVA